MKYYINTAGSKPDLEYEWYALSEVGQLEKQVPEAFSEVFQLLYYEQSSIAIICNESECLGLTLRFLDSSRTDFQVRKIYNHLTLQSDSPEENDSLQKLAAEFLQSPEEFARRVDASITELSQSDLDVCFKFDPSKIRLPAISTHLEQAGAGKITRMMGRDSGTMRSELSKQLRKYKLLLPAKQNAVLVLVSNVSLDEIQDKPHLAWTLSDALDIASDQWVQITDACSRSDSKPDRQNAVLDKPFGQLRNILSDMAPPRIAMYTILLGSALLFGWRTLTESSDQNKPAPAKSAEPSVHRNLSAQQVNTDNDHDVKRDKNQLVSTSQSVPSAVADDDSVEQRKTESGQNKPAPAKSAEPSVHRNPSAQQVNTDNDHDVKRDKNQLVSTSQSVPSAVADDDSVEQRKTEYGQNKPAPAKSAEPSVHRKLSAQQVNTDNGHDVQHEKNQLVSTSQSVPSTVADDDSVEQHKTESGQNKPAPAKSAEPSVHRNPSAQQVNTDNDHDVQRDKNQLVSTSQSILSTVADGDSVEQYEAESDESNSDIPGK